MATKKPAPLKTLKPVTFTDLAAMNKADLDKKVTELRSEIVSIKRGTLSGDVQNYKVASHKRKELARALTALNAKSGEEK